MEQLVFELAPAEPPRFANFLPGPNAELVHLLPKFVAGGVDETGLLIWGVPGSGKTHLLRAATAFARDSGIDAQFFLDADELDDATIAEPPQLVAIDNIDAAATTAAGIFTLYNRLKDRGGHLLAASRTPLVALPLREDVRTRLGWGLVYEALPLSDDDKPEAMAAFARQRGFVLSPDVIDYLLRHVRRDMPSLLATLAAMDRASLSAKRPITVPLLKTWLKASQ